EVAMVQVGVLNLGGAPVSRAGVSLYADLVRADNLLGVTTTSIAAGAAQSVVFRVSTAGMDGTRHLVAAAFGAQQELCSRNNSARVALTVVPDFARWPHHRPLRVEAGQVDREDATAEVP